MDTYDKSYEKALGQFMKKKPMLPKQDPYEKVIKILFAMSAASLVLNIFKLLGSAG